MLFSFIACPSYVALDYSVDGTVMTPASKPVMTSGLSVIRLHFDQPQVAQVCNKLDHCSQTSTKIEKLFFLLIPIFVIFSVSVFVAVGQGTRNH
jgi:hypothetical protein